MFAALAGAAGFASLLAQPLGPGEEPVIWPQGALLPLSGSSYSVVSDQTLTGNESWTTSAARVQYLATGGVNRTITLGAIGGGGFVVGDSFLVRGVASGTSALTFQSAASGLIATFGGGPSTTTRWVRLEATGTGWVGTVTSDVEYTNGAPAFSYFGDNIVPLGAAWPDSMYVHPQSPRGDGWSIRFRTSAPRFLISCKASLVQFRLRIDGEIRAVVAGGPNTGAQVNYLIDLGTSADREFEILGDFFRFWGVIVPDGAHALVPSLIPVPSTKVVSVGDSISEGGTYSLNWAAAELLGLEMWNRPWGATGYIQDANGARTNFFDRSAADVVAAAPDMIIVQGGINDLNRGYSAAAFRASVEQLFDYYNASLPAARKYALSPFWPNGFPIPETFEKRDIIEEVAASRGFHFIDWIGWITTENRSKYISGDNTHPTHLGMAYLGWLLAQEIAAVEQLPAPATGVFAAVAAPAVHATFPVGATIPIEVFLSGNIAGIDRVEFFAGTTEIGERTSAPWSIEWSGASIGTHELTAQVVMSNGAMSLSKSVPVNVHQTFNYTTPSGEAVVIRHQDIGVVNTSGSATASAATGPITMTASGVDVWVHIDSFRFAWRELTGDGSVIARVDSLVQRDAWTKAGVMFRESAAPGARNVFMTMTSANGASFQWRAINGSESRFTLASGIPIPRWVKLERIGSTLRGYHSSNGTTWTQVGTATVPFGATLQAGLAVTSHDNNALTTAVFSGLDFAQPPAPEITGIVDDTGVSASDGITSDSTIGIQGTSPPLALITVYRNSTSLVGTATASAGGGWSLDLSGTPLAEGAHVFTATAMGASGTSAHSAAFSVVVDQSSPVVVSVVRQTPAGQSISAGPVVFRVAFDEPVAGFDAADAHVATVGTVGGTISALTPVGAGLFDVAVADVSGSGVLRLDVVAAGAGVTDLAGNPLAGGFAAGETYLVGPAARYFEWIALQTDPVALQDPFGDPDDDGLKNLLEFLLLEDPLESGGGVLRATTVLVAGEAYAAVEFTRRDEVGGVSVTVEAAIDPGFGTLVPVVVQSSTPNGDGTSDWVVRGSEGLSTTPTLFFRIRAEVSVD